MMMYPGYPTYPVISHHNHFDTLPAFIKRVSDRFEDVKSCLVNTDSTIQFCFKDNESIVWSTHASHANIRPSYLDWTYKDQYMTNYEIDTELIMQYQTYASAVPTCIQYIVSIPMVVYKKVNHFDLHTGQMVKRIIEFEIPVGALVNESIIGDDKGKCRSSIAVTRYPRPNSPYCVITSLANNHYHYPITSGVIIHPERPFDPSLNVCASGIHFFKTYSEALNYQ